MKDMINKMNVNWKIFTPSILIMVLVSIPFVFNEGGALEILNGIFDWIALNFGWGYLWYAVISMAVAFWFACSKYGNIVFGDPNKKPEFSMTSFIAIKIAMAIGSSLMRTGLIHWASIAGNEPMGMESWSMEAIAFGQSHSMFLWSLPKMAILVVAAPAFAYMMHNRKNNSSKVSEVFRYIWGDKFADGIGGKAVDVLFLVSIIAGASTFIGFGAPIITHTVGHLFNLEVTFNLAMFITFAWTICFTVSATLGLKKSIQFLSNFNMWLAGIFAILILLLGPGAFIMNFFTDTMSVHLSTFGNMVLHTGALEGTGGSVQSFNIFWFAYSATWALLHAAFAAKISRGRTLREMILVYLFAPLALAYLGTAVLGGLSIERFITGVVDVPGIAETAGTAIASIPVVIQSLPMGTIMLFIFLILTFLFMVTTMDTTSFTIAMYAANDDQSAEEPSRGIRIFIGIVIGAIALVLMRIGGLAPLEVLSGLMGIPIIFVVFVLVFAAKKMMDEDKAWLTNVRPAKITTLKTTELNKPVENEVKVDEEIELTLTM